MEIIFNWNHSNTSILKNRTVLKKFLSSQYKKASINSGIINFVFVDDSFILDLNKSSLNHDYYTDIITFPLSSHPFEAELYISLDTVKSNALLHNSSFKKELHRVIFHGCLHLLGYDDKTEKDKQLMTSMEDRWLSLYNKTIDKL